MYAGQCNQMLGQYQEALAHYNYGIDKVDKNKLIDKESGELYYHRGLAWVSINDYGKAIEDF